MPFSRHEPEQLHGTQLDRAMRSIGMRIGPSHARGEAADIEATLVSAVRAALPSDYRLLGIVVAWLETHHKRVNVPRLLRMVSQDRHKLTLAWWSAAGTWLTRDDARWRTLERLYKGTPVALDDADVTELQIARIGEDARFHGSALRVHAKLLRARPEDVDDPVHLASRHALYRKRLELGPSYRADVWAALDEAPSATPAEVARMVGCAYETARSVAEDWRTARAAGLLRRARPSHSSPGRVRSRPSSPTRPRRNPAAPC